MRFSWRIFAGYFLLLGLLAAYVVSVVRDEIKPAMRRSAEAVLLDTANLLAEMVQPDMVAGRLDDGRLAATLQRFAARQPQAEVWGVRQDHTQLRVYLTDARGVVLLDSAGQAVGQDYSRWRDVALTLRGQYGARSTLADAANPLSTVMYVAAPVRDGQRIIGVLTVSRPNLAMQPHIERSEAKLGRLIGVVLLAALLLGALFSWWLSRGITRLTRFADSVSAGGSEPLPHFAANRELDTLAQALGRMRSELDGKAYVEHYVHDLTHELKSPLAGLRASAELLQDDLPPADRARFLQHIDSESVRLQQIVDHLLQLGARRVTPAATLPQATVAGDAFLLRQALRNILQNAIDFTADHGAITLQLQPVAGGWQLQIANDGPPVPDYALPRLFERFYSLPRPHGPKSSGLGLALTRTIVQLHGGDIRLANQPPGVCVTLQLPAADAANPLARVLA